MNLGIIPARLDSKRFPRKIIHSLNGKSIIQHVYDNASESKYLDKLIIAIDSEETKSHIDNSCETILTSINHQSGTDRVAEASEKFDCDIIINIQGDEPKIDSDIIDNLILLFDDPSVQMASVASTNLTNKDLSNPNVVKVYLDDNNYAINFEREIVKKDQQYFRHIGIYAYRKEVLMKFTSLEQTENEKELKLEQLRALDNNLAIKILITNFQHRSIDIEEDLKYYEV
ncbi:MAG: 3-deoxy-manno-octulosonate cytidylyltransferase [Candidatus Neomarinimicrobiota bacterium]|nr:3-deoxy-manno-octulosonate cytidylyltransferase [Candidatus Neomarinimicrobiota bacterium]